MDLQVILNLREILKIGRKKVQGNYSMNKDEKTVMRNHNDGDEYDDDDDNDDHFLN
jgi:hypothetical protein